MRDHYLPLGCDQAQLDAQPDGELFTRLDLLHRAIGARSRRQCWRRRPDVRVSLTGIRSAGKILLNDGRRPTKAH